MRKLIGLSIAASPFVFTGIYLAITDFTGFLCVFGATIIVTGLVIGGLAIAFGGDE